MISNSTHQSMGTKKTSRKLDEASENNFRPFLVLGMDKSVAKTVFRNVSSAELDTFRFSPKPTKIEQQLNGSPAEIIVVYDSGLTDWDFILQSVLDLRHQEYNGIIILVTEDASTERLVQAYQASVTDYLVNSRYLDLPGELLRRGGIYACTRRNARNPEAIGETGFFRSLGLTAKQIHILTEYARDFPRHEEFARRLKISSVRLRSIFSEIYRKLSGPLAVETQAQLAQLLTVFTIYG